MNYTIKNQYKKQRNKMISVREIEKEAYKPSITKAYELYQNGRVKNLQIKKANPLVAISAQIDGSQGIPYKMSAMIDESCNRILNYSCDCPAIDEYDGLCKHCTAMLLQYIKGRNEKEKQSERKGIGTNQPVTSSIVRNMLNYYGMQEKIPFLQSEIHGKVQVKPTLKIEYNNIFVEFKVGITKMYIMKNIRDFVEAVKNSSKYTYGKSLSFYHYEDSFTEESKPFIHFICQAAESSEVFYNSYNSYTYGSCSRYRALLLRGYTLDHFIGLNIGKKLEIDLPEEIKSYQVSTEKLPAFVDIKEENGGILLDVTRYISFVGAEYLYYMDSSKLYIVKRAERQSLNQFRKCFDSMLEKKMFIAEKELPFFCRNLLPLLKQQYEVRNHGFDESRYLPEQAIYEFYLDMPQKDMIQCKAYALYEKKKYNILEEAKVEENRDVKEEFKVSQAIKMYFNAYDEKESALILSGDEEMLYYFLCEGIPQLHEYGSVHISDAIQKLKVIPAPHVKLGVSIEGNLLEFEMQSEDMSMEELAEILSKYNRKKRYYRLKDGTFIRMENELDGLLNISKSLQLKESDLKKRKLTIPAYRAFYLDGVIKEFGMDVQKDRNFKNLVRNMKTAEENDFEIPESLDKILRNYQKSGFLWLKTLMQNGFGGILADDMGLGKTIQIIALLQSVFEEQKKENFLYNSEKKMALIVAPASLVFNWQNEIKHFAPELSVVMLTGTVQERQTKLKEAASESIFVTSYDLLKRDISDYQNIKFQIQVIDEAQYIKNASAQAAKAVKVIDAGFKVALTGTPIENRLSELWSIFDYLLPGFLYNYSRFRNEFETRIVGNNNKEAMERLKRMIQPFVLRRLKKDVLTDLPDKIEKVVYASMEGEQKKLYQAHAGRLKLFLEEQSEAELKMAKLYVLSELTKLRQLCCNPGLLYENYNADSSKLDLCLETIKMAAESGHKVLVFSQFTSNFELLEERLEKEQLSWYCLTGSTKKENRLFLVEQFNKNKVPVFLISLKAGGTGLNLTAADIVIHYDPWWNLAVQNQATDRAHRIGQKNTVTVYKLIMKDTIEEKIIELQEKKSDLAEQVLGGKGMSETSFNKEELLQLLQ